MSSRPKALVTGASAGIGRSFAEQLASQGHDLIVVARRKERLEALADELNTKHGTKVEVVALDLGTHAGVDALVDRAASEPLDVVINNAGFGGYRPFVDVDP